MTKKQNEKNFSKELDDELYNLLYRDYKRLKHKYKKLKKSIKGKINDQRSIP